MPLTSSKARSTLQKPSKVARYERKYLRWCIAALAAPIAAVLLLSYVGFAKAQQTGLLTSSAALLEAVKEFQSSEEFQEMLKGTSPTALYISRGKEPELLKKLDEVFASLSKVNEDFKVIHGVDDDRRNYYEVGLNEQQAARSTGILVRTAEILEGDTPGFKNLSSVPAGLCAVEAFNQEPAPGFCSSVRVGERTVATAGHCIDSQADCIRTSVVFGFRMESAGDKPEKGIADGQIYQCRKLMHRKLDPRGADWALLEVDRDIESSVPIAALRQSDRMSNGDRITVVGYPMGLPVKITGNAIVKSQEREYFRANPDTYGGNSGSPVFNTDNLSRGQLFVEGLLVRGAKDFEQLLPCMRSNWCPEDDGCPDSNGNLRFEEVTYATEFSHYVANN